MSKRIQRDNEEKATLRAQFVARGFERFWHSMYDIDVIQFEDVLLACMKSGAHMHGEDCTPEMSRFAAWVAEWEA